MIRPDEIWPAATEETVAVAALMNPIGLVNVTDPATAMLDAVMVEAASAEAAKVFSTATVLAVTLLAVRLPAVTAALPSAATVTVGAEMTPVTARMPTVAESAACTVPLLI